MILQTGKNGKPAKGPTAEEFSQYVMRRFINTAEDVVEAQADEIDGSDKTPLYSYDHATIHDCEAAECALEALGFSQTKHRVLLPARSPDFHCVIENAHAWTVAAFKRLLLQDTHTRTMDGYRNLLQRAFNEAVTPERVYKDVQRLPALYKVVANKVSQGGSWGGWPPRRYM